jgi:hypothetical protein
VTQLLPNLLSGVVLTESGQHGLISKAREQLCHCLDIGRDMAELFGRWEMAVPTAADRYEESPLHLQPHRRFSTAS